MKFSHMRFKTILLFLSVLALSLSSCEKAPEKESIKAVTGDAIEVGNSSVVLTGKAELPTTPTGAIVIGVQYSLSSEDLLSGNSPEIKAETFSKDYSFSVVVEGLKPDTKYYYRTFVKESSDYSFGETKSFTTAKAPSIKLSTESASFDGLEHVGSFDVTVENPITECSLSASTTDAWITDVKISYNTVSYRVAVNNSEVQRTGKIKVTYGPVTEDFSVVQEYSDSFKGHEYVDLGLSVKWATCNVGASKPEGYGGLYQWAGMMDVTDESIKLNKSNCPYHIGSDEDTGWTKYVRSDYASYWSGAGSPDNKTVLDPSDDVANVAWKECWRMPTSAEWDELLSTDNCLWTWTSINEINGYKVQSKKSGYTDKWIFLPAAGYRGSGHQGDAGSSGCYWSSSLSSWRPSCAMEVDIISFFGVYNTSGNRYRGNSVRPVYACTHVLECIPGSIPSEGKSGWEDVYRCKECGLYFEDAEGTVLIGVQSDFESWKSEGGDGYLPPLVYHEYVDLGLSVKWATCNVGASKPEDYGGYYQWAGIKDFSDLSISPSWDNCPYHTGSDRSTGWTKYVCSDYASYWSGTGSPDNKTVLDPRDDVVHKVWGGTWRMPTEAEWMELRDNCSWTWTTINGINGYMVQSNRFLYTSNWIFLPAAGYRNGDYLNDVGSEGNYWSSSLDTYSGPCYAFGTNFNAAGWFPLTEFRYFGLSVRPVSE